MNKSHVKLCYKGFEFHYWLKHFKQLIGMLKMSVE